mmetsp:Transcript_13309/g.15169  ORF Transcript_13309/g.15169 Transcript_13309/m.15169 type:complete len:170 (+) Transcript_13309:25-534(+)
MSNTIHEVGQLVSQKYVGPGSQFKSYGWLPAKIKLYNVLFVIEYDDENFQDDEVRISWEVVTSGIKEISQAGEDGTFTIRVGDKSIFLVTKKCKEMIKAMNDDTKNSATQSVQKYPGTLREILDGKYDGRSITRKKLERILMGDPGDKYLVLKAESQEEAQHWIDNLQT